MHNLTERCIVGPAIEQAICNLAACPSQSVFQMVKVAVCLVPILCLILSPIALYADSINTGLSLAANLVMYGSLATGSFVDIGGSHTFTWQGSSAYATNGGRNSLNLSGTNYLNTPAASDLRITGSMTLVAWVYDQPGGASAVSVMGHVVSDYSYQIQVDPGSQQCVCRFKINGSQQTASYPAASVAGGLSFMTTQWNMVACRYDSVAGTLTVNVNGNSPTVTSGLSGLINDTTDAIAVGSRGEGVEQYTKPVGETMIFSRALSDGEISTLYNSRDYLTTFGSSSAARHRMIN